MTQAESCGFRQAGRLIMSFNAVSFCSKDVPRVAAYLRCAVEDEEYIAAQLAGIQQYLEDRGWGLDCTYSDNSYSGNSGRCPALLRLRQDIQDGRVDEVAVCNLARLFRALSGLQHSMRLLEEHPYRDRCAWWVLDAF